MKYGIVALILCLLCSCLASTATMCPDDNTDWARFCGSALGNVASIVCVVATGFLAVNIFQ